MNHLKKLGIFSLDFHVRVRWSQAKAHVFLIWFQSLPCMLTAEIVNYVPLANIVSYGTIGYECWKQGCSWLSLQICVFFMAMPSLASHMCCICSLSCPAWSVCPLHHSLLFVQMLTPASGKATVPTAFTVCLFTFQTCIFMFSPVLLLPCGNSVRCLNASDIQIAMDIFCLNDKIKTSTF